MHREYDLKDRLQPLWEPIGGRDELARRTGITGTTLSAYNTGNRAARITNVQKIADALDVHIIEVIGSESSSRETELLLKIVTLLEERSPVDAGLSPLLLQLSDDLQEISTRLRQVVASRDERSQSA